MTNNAKGLALTSSGIFIMSLIFFFAKPVFKIVPLRTYDVIAHEKTLVGVDIITQAIEGAQSLLDVLKQRALTSDELTKVGNTIAQFHNLGVYHADLNINNILFDNTGAVYIIDFDRGEIKAVKGQWQEANISRLLRSFDKERNRNQVMHWQQSDWQQLNTAYQSSLKPKI